MSLSLRRTRTFIRLLGKKDLANPLKFRFSDECSQVLPEHLRGPAECQQGQRRQVVDEHLCEVLPLNVRELCEKQGPVEGHLEHVVPPNCEIWIGVLALM